MSSSRGATATQALEALTWGLSILADMRKIARVTVWVAIIEMVQEPCLRNLGKLLTLLRYGQSDCTIQLENVKAIKHDLRYMFVHGMSNSTLSARRDMCIS